VVAHFYTFTTERTQISGQHMTDDDSAIEYAQRLEECGEVVIGILRDGAPWLSGQALREALARPEFPIF
jgi:hypothetical protein